MATDDPFPFFHLSDLNFPVSSSDLPKLSGSQLALAPFSSEWDDSLEKKVIRTFRQRREKSRDKIGKAKLGVYAAEEERRADPWHNFELLDLTYKLPEDLNQLTSAQLATIPFHPDTTKDLAEDATDIFFARREKDFATGLTLASALASRSSKSASRHVKDPTPPIRATTPPHRAPVSTTMKSRVSSGSSSSTMAASSSKAQDAPRSGPAVWLAEESDIQSQSSASTPAAAAPPKKTLDEFRAAASVSREQSRASLSEESRSARRQKADRDSSPATQERDRSRSRMEVDKPERKRDRSVESVLEARESRRRRSSPGSSVPSPEKPLGSSSSRMDVDEPLNTSTKSHKAPPRSRASSPGRYSKSRAPIDIDWGEVPAHLQSPYRPVGPLRDESWTPLDFEHCLTSVALGGIVRETTIDEVRAIILSNSQVHPVAIKIIPRALGKGHSTNKETTTAFVAFLLPEDAETIVRRLRGYNHRGEIISAVIAMPKADFRQWKWGDCADRFKEDWLEGRVKIGRPLSIHGGRNADAGYGTRAHSPLPMPSLPRRPSPDVPNLRSSLPAPPSGLPKSRTSGFPRQSLDPGGQSYLDDEVPSQLGRYLHQLFVSNLPEDITLEELRDFFDDSDGLVGIAVGTKNYSFHNCSAWLAFATIADRDATIDAFSPKTYPSMRQRLYFERPEEKNKHRPFWRWGELAKAFRDKHLSSSAEKKASISGSRTHNSEEVKPSIKDRSPSPKPAQSSSAVPTSASSAPPSKAKIHPSRLQFVPVESPARASGGGSALDDILASLQSIPPQQVTSASKPKTTPTGSNGIPSGPRRRDSAASGAAHDPSPSKASSSPKAREPSPSKQASPKKAADPLPFGSPPPSISELSAVPKSPSPAGFSIKGSANGSAPSASKISISLRNPSSNASRQNDDSRDGQNEAVPKSPEAKAASTLPFVPPGIAEMLNRLRETSNDTGEVASSGGAEESGSPAMLPVLRFGSTSTSAEQAEPSWAKMEDGVPTGPRGPKSTKNWADEIVEEVSDVGEGATEAPAKADEGDSDDELVSKALTG